MRTRSTPPTEGRSGRELNMSDAVTRVSVEIEGKEISFETGKLAKQASGAVVVRSGDTDGPLYRHRGQPPRRGLSAADG